MTYKQIIELIQQHHPDMGETELKLNINIAQRDFADKTKLFERSVAITSVAGQRWYTLVGSTYPIGEFKKIYVNDVEIPRLVGDVLIDDDEREGTNPLATPTASSNERFWYTRQGVDGAELSQFTEIALVEKGIVSRDDKQSNYQSISIAAEVRILYSSGLSDVSSLTATLPLSDNLTIAIPYKVISDGYLKGNQPQFNPELAGLFDIKYKELVKDGKKKANMNGISGARIIKPQEF